MANFRLLKSEVKPLSRELAAQFRDMEPSPTERDINPARMRYLREKAEAGQLVTFHWATAKMGNKTLRTNGQHSSNMLCELNGAFPEGMFVHMDHYEVDSPEGLALLFRQFDARKSGRSAGDVSGAYQNLFPDLQPLAKPIAKLGIEGVVWYRRIVEGAPAPSGDDMYHLFNEQGLHGFLIWLNEVFSIKTPEMRQTQVVAAMYATFIANETEARKFWDQVARGGVEYEDNAPSTILDAWLKSAKAKELKVEPKAGNYYQGCIYAWNAYREDKQVKDIKSDTSKSWHNPVV